jgi:hypothetical protein
MSIPSPAGTARPMSHRIESVRGYDGRVRSASDKMNQSPLTSTNMHAAESKPDISLILRDSLPAEFEAGLLKDLKDRELQVRVLRIPGGPFAGVELYLPAAAMLFIATGYFSGFLNKAGEDHYELLKRAAKKLWQRAARLRITPIGSGEKKLSNSPFSLAYAIMGEVGDGLRFKFVVRMELGEAEADEAIRAFLDLLRAIHDNAVSEEDMEALLTYRPVGGTVIVTFDPKEKRVVPVNAFERDSRT